MSEYLNATCSICGKKYHVCASCRDTRLFQAWKSVTDSPICWQIYGIIYDYNRGKIKKNEAKAELNKIKLPDISQDHIKKAIDEIMFEEKNVSQKENTITPKKKTVSKLPLDQDTKDVIE